MMILVSIVLIIRVTVVDIRKVIAIAPPEQVELANHSLQHTQYKICPTCDGEGEFFSVLWDKTISCIRCGGSGKLRASA